MVSILIVRFCSHLIVVCVKPSSLTVTVSYVTQLCASVTSLFIVDYEKHTCLHSVNHVKVAIFLSQWIKRMEFDLFAVSASFLSLIPTDLVDISGDRQWKLWRGIPGQAVRLGRAGGNQKSAPRQTVQGEIPDPLPNESASVFHVLLRSKLHDGRTGDSPGYLT